MIEAGSLIRSLSGRPAARNFHSFVINEIGLGIVTGKFPVGSILASDAVMMETYGVSRTVLREALKTLEAKGLVEARPKVGTRVSPTSRWSLFDPQVLSWYFYAKPDARFYASLFDIRRALEPLAASHAAQRRTAENIRVMKYWLHQMNSAGGDLENHGIAALEIHRIIADTSGNALMRSVTGIVELTLALSLRQAGANPAPHLAAELDTLTFLVAAIADSDSDAAMTHVQRVIDLDETLVRSALA